MKSNTRPEITIDTYSYKDLKNGISISNDSYGVGGYSLTSARRKAFIECPYVKDEDFVMLCLIRVNGVVCGRVMFFPTLFKAGDEVLDTNGGSSLYVQRECRKYDLAVDIIMYPITNHLSNGLIYADFSKDGIDVYRALRFTIFSLKKMFLVRNSKFIYESIGLKGGLLKIFTSITNCFLRPLTGTLVSNRIPKRLRSYTLSEVQEVPAWVDDMVLNDGHKYMESHDHRWLQWCLNNKFHEEIENVNRFYIVEKEGEPWGFIFTKERVVDIPTRKISRLLIGSIIEWGSKNESILSEFDIIRLALPTFSPQIDYIQICSDDEITIKRARKCGFIGRGYHYIAYRDLTKRFKDSKNQKLWRLRFGYSDSIMN